jgi:2-iminobutanoate/2-iminopropanoate deaminase
VYSQTRQILASFRVMLRSVDSDLDHVTHVSVFLLNMADFDEMNRGYVEAMDDPAHSSHSAHRPARTTIGVASLPKPGAVVTMSLTAVTRNRA